MEKTTDRYLQSSFGLWNAILTINGILLAALSSVKLEGSVSNKLILFITIFCVISIVSIVYNFFAAKATYYRMAEVMLKPDEVTEDIKNKDIKKSLSRRKIMIFSEKLCLTLLIVESFLILGLIGVRFYGQ